MKHVTKPYLSEGESGYFREYIKDFTVKNQYWQPTSYTFEVPADFLLDRGLVVHEHWGHDKKDPCRAGVYCVEVYFLTPKGKITARQLGANIP